jgi:hypothetical protein
VLVAYNYEPERVVQFTRLGDDLHIISIHKCSFGYIISNHSVFQRNLLQTSSDCSKAVARMHGVVRSGMTLGQRQGQERLRLNARCNLPPSLLLNRFNSL